MDRVFIQPSVKLINSTEGFVGFFLWMKSRQEVITDLDGNHFMRDAKLDFHWYDTIPEEFLVGEEKVKRDDYYAKIDRQNLQYNNSEFMLFEINGSCLFRDLCYNLAGTTQWAESNRFLFSILDENARFDSRNYKISEEYKDIPEWEDQFRIYMETIKNDPIVDHNRLEMPYSISSRFWFGCNRRQLRAFLGYLRFKVPFFYKVYGDQLMSQSDIEPSMLPRETDSFIEQFRIENDESIKGDFEEKVEKVHGDIYVSSKMGLILFSQFVRQTDSCIKGYLDILEHENPEEFSHIVFKGDTIFNIVYRAPKAKLMKTVQTRLCAFAMSSGEGPCSWSYFLNHFIPEVITPIELMEMLPCKFHQDRLVYCKFREDIKFRNEGKEISNCPCPLVTLSMKDAENKLQRDNNRIGRAFYDLTKYMKFHGLGNEYSTERWTSKLVIQTETPLDNVQIGAINELADMIESNWPYNDENQFDYEKWGVSDYEKYSLNGDPTCMLKGLLIDKISKILLMGKYNKFIISFGGDIFIYNTNSNISIDGTKFSVKLDGIYSMFTSGNTEKRGDHIIGCNPGEQVTVLVRWDNIEDVDNTLVDIMTTKFAANERQSVESIINTIQMKDIDVLRFIDGKLTNTVYCASPFFNEEQVAIRDRMVSQFINAFRPDLTKSSEAFSFGDDEAAIKVVEENIDGIQYSDYLVFPMNTLDLGTLFEVGYALGIHDKIISYDESNDRYTLETRIFEVEDELKLQENKDYLFDCSKKREVITLGAASTILPKNRIFYELKGCKDNLMLSVNYTHVEFEDGEYKVIIRDKHSRDE